MSDPSHTFPVELEALADEIHTEHVARFRTRYRGVGSNRSRQASKYAGRANGRVRPLDAREMEEFRAHIQREIERR